MHISEGILSAPVLAGGGLLTAVGTALGLRRLTPERLPRVAVMGAAFFVASLVHVPIGPSSAHLILNGLCGLILGWSAFPALLVSLFLQALLFGFGGLTTLGVNTFDMAAPAVACAWLFGKACNNPARPRLVFAAGAAAGALAVALGCLATATALFLSGREFIPAIIALAAAHIPIMIAEGLITGWAAWFLAKIKPELLR